MAAISRPYDDFIPAPLLAKIKLRRHSPDGLVHEVKEITRAGRRVYDYPWKKMELGDFFIVPIGDRSEKALRVAFAHGAARHDLEIAVTKWRLPDDEWGFRVAVVIIGVSQYKHLALNAGISGIRISDGRWTARRRRWETENRTKRGRKDKQPEPLKTKAKQPDLSNPFWADDEPEAA